MEEKNTEFEEENISEKIKEEKFAYKSIIEENNKTRLFSVASVITGIFSVVFCFLPVLGIILSLFSLAFSVISRKVIGYFDHPSILGLVIGIFGFVFGVGYAILHSVLINISLF